MKLVASDRRPHPGPGPQAARDPDSWVTAAAGSWVVGLDNLSTSRWLSDSICRAVTGDGDVRRRLYTDADLAVFAFRRCILFNGIDLGGLHGDLADRLVPIHLRRIADSARLDEEQLWPAWDDAHPASSAPCSTWPRASPGALPDCPSGDQAPDGRLRPDPRRRRRGARHRRLTRYLAKQGALATDCLTGDHFVTAITDPSTATSTARRPSCSSTVTPADDDWRAPKAGPPTPGR